MSVLRIKKPEHNNPPSQPSRLPQRWAIIIGFSQAIGIALWVTVGPAVGVPAAFACAMFLYYALE